jgi:hypothetical protein
MAERDSRDDFSQGYGEREYGQDRENFRQNERDRLRDRSERERLEGRHENRSRWDRNLSGRPGHEGHREQNEWSASHGAWSDPAHEYGRDPGSYAEGGRYYGEPADATRGPAAQW